MFFLYTSYCEKGPGGEMADTLALGASAERRRGSNPLLGTSKEIASFEGSPRFARRLICIEFSGQKRIGDFAFCGKKIF